jgi:thioredoxin 1
MAHGGAPEYRFLEPIQPACGGPGLLRRPAAGAVSLFLARPPRLGVGAEEPSRQAPRYTLYSIGRRQTDQTNRSRTAAAEEEATMAGTLSEVTDANFQAEVIESEQPVLVDFWAPWCGPCRVVGPVLEEIAGERPDLRVVKLNVDDNQQTAASYQVLSIPTMILFKAGQPVKTVVGAYPKKKIEAELAPALA